MTTMCKILPNMSISVPSIHEGIVVIYEDKAETFVDRLEFKL